MDKPVEQLRRDALSIFDAAVKGADAADAVRRHLKVMTGQLEVGGRRYDLSAYDGIYAVGAGKVAARMAQPVEELLRNRIKAGSVNVNYGQALPLRVVKVHEAGHPVPDQAGVRGAEEIVNLVQMAGEGDLVVCLLCGGGSALFPYPAEGLTLEDKQKTTRLLLQCGATIQELNAVRKHLSRVKGGRLAELAYPSTVISLILSDVIDDDLDTIASGPTAPDRSTFADCWQILKTHSIEGIIPPAVKIFLEKGAKGEIEETPKPGDPTFRRTQNVIVGSNALAIRAAQEKAQQLGYHTLVLSSSVEGESREVAKEHAAIAKEVIRSGHPIQRPACVISGGETTVTVRGRGLGGRNQEFALAAAIAIEGCDGMVILNGATDGKDGPTDATGAIIDGTTARRAKTAGLHPQSFLNENDSYHFFEKVGGLLKTGPTHTNVMDLQLILLG